jgi:hypothetical protein
MGLLTKTQPLSWMCSDALAGHFGAGEGLRFENTHFWDDNP